MLFRSPPHPTPPHPTPPHPTPPHPTPPHPTPPHPTPPHPTPTPPISFPSTPSGTPPVAANATKAVALLDPLLPQDRFPPSRTQVDLVHLLKISAVSLLSLLSLTVKLLSFTVKLLGLAAAAAFVVVYGVAPALRFFLKALHSKMDKMIGHWNVFTPLNRSRLFGVFWLVIFFNCIVIDASQKLEEVARIQATARYHEKRDGRESGSQKRSLQLTAEETFLDSNDWDESSGGEHCSLASGGLALGADSAAPLLASTQCCTDLVAASDAMLFAGASYDSFVTEESCHDETCAAAFAYVIGAGEYIGMFGAGTATSWNTACAALHRRKLPISSYIGINYQTGSASCSDGFGTPKSVLMSIGGGPVTGQTFVVDTSKLEIDSSPGASGTGMSECQGDCDGDVDCNGDLVCFQRNGFTAIPGCEGAGVESWDYCVDPSPTQTTSQPVATFSCPSVVNSNVWKGTEQHGDTFSVSETVGGIQVARTDTGDPESGWGMNLQFYCFSGCTAPVCTGNCAAGSGCSSTSSCAVCPGEQNDPTLEQCQENN